MLLSSISAVAIPVLATVFSGNKDEGEETWDSGKYNITSSSSLNKNHEAKAKDPVVMTRTNEVPTPSPIKSQQKFHSKSIDQLTTLEHQYGNYGIVSLANPGEHRMPDREMFNYASNMTPDYASGGTSFLSFSLLEPIYSQTPTPKSVTVKGKGLPRNVKGAMKITKVGDDSAKGKAFVNADGTITIEKGLVCGKRVLALQAGSSISLSFPDEPVTSMLDYDARHKKEKVDSFTNPRMNFDDSGKAVLLNSMNEDRNTIEDERQVRSKQMRLDTQKILDRSSRHGNEPFQFAPNMEHADLDQRQVARITRDGCPVRRGGKNFKNEKGRMDNDVNMRLRSKAVRLQKKTEMSVRDGILRPNVEKKHHARSHNANDSTSRTGRSVRFSRSTRDKTNMPTQTYARSDDMVRRKDAIGGLGVRSNDVRGQLNHGRSTVRPKLTRRSEPSAGVLLGRTENNMSLRAPPTKAPRTKFRREPLMKVYSALARQAPRKTRRAGLSSTLHKRKSAMKYRSDEFETIHRSRGISIHGSHRNNVQDIATRRTDDGTRVVRLNRREAWAAGDQTIDASRTDRGANFSGPNNNNFGGKMETHREREYREPERNKDRVTNQTYRHKKVHSKFVYDQQRDVAFAADRYRKAGLNTDVPVSLTNEKNGVVLHKDTRDRDTKVGIVGNEILMDTVASASSRGVSKHQRLERDNASIADRRVFAPLKSASVMMDVASVQKTMRFVKATETNTDGAKLQKPYNEGYRREHEGLYVPKDAEGYREDSRREKVLNYDPHSNEAPHVPVLPGTATADQTTPPPLPLQTTPPVHDNHREVRFLQHSIQESNYDA